MKKIICFLLVTVMLGSVLAGCGSHKCESCDDKTKSDDQVIYCEDCADELEAAAKAAEDAGLVQRKTSDSENGLGGNKNTTTTFYCDICREEVTGLAQTATIAGGEVTYCEDCADAAQSLQEAYGSYGSNYDNYDDYEEAYGSYDDYEDYEESYGDWY